MQQATFTNKLDTNYKYMVLPNGEADVFIYDFVEEKETEYGKDFIYNFNQFRAKTDEITEEMIKKDPLSYLNYTPEQLSESEEMKQLKEEVKGLKEKIEKLEKQ